MRRKPLRVVVVCLFTIFILCHRSLAQQPGDNRSAVNPLVRVLQAKGILTAEEVAQISQASSASDADQRLAKLLLMKDVISQAEYDLTVGAPGMMNASSTGASGGGVVAAVYRVPVSNGSNSGTRSSRLVDQGAAAAPAVVPAVAPLRVLPIDVPKQGGLIPDIKLGSGASMKLYGFFKASAVEDTASSGGATFGSNDFPLPLLLGGDTGPTTDSQFHIKARSFRIGSNFEWVPKDSNLAVTAKVEADFEGDYTNVNNRNISGVRSSQFSIRLAYMRLDDKLGGALPWFAQFGQDWSLLSSTLPNLFETTGLGLGMGSLWERMPQFRTGVQFHAGDLKIQPEVAIVLPIAGSAALTDEQRARFGDRAGAESNQPGVEGRVVFQFPLSHSWKGVVPAQFIVSGHHARMNEIIPHAAQAVTTCVVLPCTPFSNPSVPNVGFTTANTILNASNCTTSSGICNLEQLFPRGTQAGNPQNIWTTEIQLPTPWVTFDAKFYKGNDMRFFFGGQFNDIFSNLHGLFEVGNGVSFSGRPILFGCAGGTTIGQPAATIDCQGTPVLSANLQPIGGVGGFSELSFPLSRN